MNTDLLQQPNTAVLETENLLLKPITDGDQAHIFAYLSDRSIRHRMKMHTWKTAEEQATWWEKFQLARNKGEAIQWCAFHKQTGDYVGLLTLKEISASNSRAELGYSIAKAQWGKGFGKEAAAEIVRFAFEKLELHSIYAIILPYNTPSQRIALGLGFVQQGHFYEEHFYEGHYYDTLYFTLLNPAQKHLRALNQEQ